MKMRQDDLFFYFGFIVLITAIVSAIAYFFKKNKILKIVLFTSSAIASLYVFSFAFVYYFMAYKPYKKLHENDDKYFGKYYYKAKNQKDTTFIFLDSNFTFRIHNKYNLPFFDSGKWIANNTDDYQFEFINDEGKKFFAVSETDSVNSVLKLHKKTYDDNFFVFKKIKN